MWYYEIQTQLWKQMKHYLLYNSHTCIFSTALSSSFLHWTVSLFPKTTQWVWHQHPIWQVRKWGLIGHCWLTLIMLATWEAEIRKDAVQSQPGQTVFNIPPHSKISKAKWTRGVAPVIRVPALQLWSQIQSQSHKKRKESRAQVAHTCNQLLRRQR
jgi:uncharacterized membrane protein